MLNWHKVKIEEEAARIGHEFGCNTANALLALSVQLGIPQEEVEETFWSWLSVALTSARQGTRRLGRLDPNGNSGSEG